MKHISEMTSEQKALAVKAIFGVSTTDSIRFYFDNGALMCRMIFPGFDRFDPGEERIRKVGKEGLKFIAGMGFDVINRLNSDPVKPNILYLLRRPPEPGKRNYYCEYISAVVCASDEASARMIYPGMFSERVADIYVDWWKPESREHSNCMCAWILPEQVVVIRIGIAEDTVKPGTVICSNNGGAKQTWGKLT